MDIWSNVLNYVRRHVNDGEFQLWFGNIKPLGVKNGELVLGVRNSFAADWLKSHYLEILQDALKELGAEHPRIHFEVLQAVQDAMMAPIKTEVDIAASVFVEPPRTNLNPKYIFEHFVIGPNNNLAHAAALAVAEAPGKAYNPFFIYGDVGLGKTHLMHAVGHHVALRHPHMRIEYVSTESFTNDLINAIRDDKMTAFRNRYRSIDLLLVDDIQFLAGKERTQEEFFHTFNALHENHKQIILSSDRPPRDIETLEARLRSRFEWGLITDIQSPEFETRVAILKKNAEVRKMTIPQDVLELIAKHVTSNIRELEGALMRVMAFASLNNVEITHAVAAKALSEIFTPTPIQVDMKDVLQAIAQAYGVSIEALKSSGRARDIVLPRQIAMYLIRELTSHSLPEIGQFFGRDHSTVLHATQKITEQVLKDQETAKSIQHILSRLRLAQQ